MGIGDKIRYARQKAGMSQAKLAGLVGVKPGTISSWEANRTEPDANSIVRIAKATGVTTDFLLGMPDDFSGMPDNVKDMAERIIALPHSDRAIIEKVLSAMADREGEKKVIPTSQNR